MISTIPLLAGASPVSQDTRKHPRDQQISLTVTTTSLRLRQFYPDSPWHWAFGTGWITYASWSNSTGTPVSSFSTQWYVPPAPIAEDGQIIFLFNGIQNSTMIYQPVLQWGVSAAGGGNYWAVASWYADGQGGPAFHSDLVRVNPGDLLTRIRE